jgi:hypothetical protein
MATALAKYKEIVGDLEAPPAKVSKFPEEQVVKWQI